MTSGKPSAIVTGAGRGIGRAIAIALANAGYAITITSRTESELKQLAGEITAAGGSALALAADIADEHAIQRLVEQSVGQFGRVDLLVNNAGIGTFAPVAEMKTEDFDRMFATNVRGAFLATRAVLPFMIRQNQGDIVNIASLAGRNSFKGGAGYSATKWALIGFARSLMLEVRENNIRVITVCPGSVDTFFDPHSSARKNADAIPKAGDIATVVLDAIRMPRNVMVSEIDVRPTNPRA